MLVVAAVVLGWVSAADARGAQNPDPNEEITASVDCLLSPEAMSNSTSVPGGAAQQLSGTNQLVQMYRRIGWTLEQLGVGGLNWVNPFTAALKGSGSLHATHQVRAPRWYVDEARREAEEHDNCALVWSRPIGDCSQWQPYQPTPYGSGSSYFEPGGNRPVEPDVSDRNGLVRFLPDKCWGAFPADAYELYYSSSGFALHHKAWALMTGFFHQIGKGAMQLALASVGFAFSTFHLLDYKDFALDAAVNYEKNLVGPFGLEEIAFFSLVGYAAVKALRGKLGIAGGEIAVALLAGTLAAVLMANREGYLEGAATTMDELTVSILAAGEGSDPTTAHGYTVWYVRPVQRVLFQEFVDRPYDYVNFGGEITNQTCIDRRNRLLSASVQDDGGWGIRYMDGRDPGDVTCDAHAVAMGRPTRDRMVIALITMVVCVGVAVIVGGAALVMLLSKILLLVLFAVAPFAAVGAMLPAVGRRLAWAWVAVVLQALLAAAGMSFVLSMFLLGFQGVVERSEALSPFERWLLMLVIVGVMYLVRLRLLNGTKAVANTVSDQLTRLSPGSAHWERRDGGVGLDLRTADSKVRRAQMSAAGYALGQAPLMGLAAVGAVGGMMATGYGRWRTGQISLRNLRKMERYREDIGATDGMRGLSFHGPLRRSALRRLRRAGHPHVPAPNPSRARPGGGGGSGPGPTGPRGPQPPPSPTPRPRGPRDRPQGPGGGAPRPGGNWVAARWELTKDTLKLDRGAEVASAAANKTAEVASAAANKTVDTAGRAWNAANRSWDDKTAALARGARRVGQVHPGPGGRALRVDTLAQRWSERGDTRQSRADDRRDLDARYLERRQAERERAATFGPGRRRLTPEERAAQFGVGTSPREDRRRAIDEFHERFNPEAVRLRDQPIVRGLRRTSEAVRLRDQPIVRWVRLLPGWGRRGGRGR